MRKEFVMRGQTVPGNTEILNFSGFKPGLAYRMTEFEIYPSTSIGSGSHEMVASVTAGKTAVDPTSPNFDDEGLIAVCQYRDNSSTNYQFTGSDGIVNDTFLITQNLILMTQDATGSSEPVNWQCRFEAVKMSGSEEAVTNYKQFAISDE